MTGVDTGLSKPQLDRVCRLWQGVSYSSSKDTKETIVNIRVNNATRDAFCPE